uniref:Uncharacterized protein n=1 Tax=Arundo donax TaxID=35708 RepID=A0A0A8YBJ0_ARUDO
MQSFKRYSLSCLLALLTIPTLRSTV